MEATVMYYCAGMLDAHGTLSLDVIKRGRGEIRARLRMGHPSKEVLDLLYSALKNGRVRGHGGSFLYELTDRPGLLTSLEAIEPFLAHKRRQAQAIIVVLRHLVGHSPTRLTLEELDWVRGIVVQAWHQPLLSVT